MLIKFINNYLNGKNITQYDNGKIRSLNFVEKKHLFFQEKSLICYGKVVFLQIKIF